MSKVYERIVLTQLSEHIEISTTYQSTQHGFRKSHSTITCLLKLRDDILRAMDKGEITIGVFADYSKAFDTIDYECLIRKLHTLNFSKVFLYWLVEYLKERTHFVQIDDKKSETLISGFGVPQGSILGPVLFNLYVADLNLHLKSCESLQYADDTSIYIQCKPKEINAAVSNITEDIENMQIWSQASNLVFNEKKTKSMYFCTRRLQQAHDLKDNQFVIKLNKGTLQQTNEMKILGVIFDNHLTWKIHTNKVIKDCFSTLRTLRSISRLLPYQVKKQLATTLILSKLDYGNVVTSNLPRHLLKSLQKVQNAAAGFVLRRHATTEDVIKLSWLPIQQRLEYSLAVLAYKSINGMCPENMNVRTKIDRRNLRSNQENVGPMIECNEKAKTFQHDAALVFNSLPKKIREVNKISMFKTNLKNFLLDKALANHIV